MPIYTTPNGKRYEFDNREAAKDFERDYPNAKVELYNGDVHYNVPLQNVDAFFNKYPDGDYWSTLRTNQPEPKESPAQQKQEPGFLDRFASVGNYSKASMSGNGQAQPQQQTVSQPTENTDLKAKQQQYDAAKAKASQQIPAAPNFNEKPGNILPEQPSQQPRFDYRQAENGFVNPATQKSMPNISDIDKMAEEERNIQFTPKKVEKGEDIMQNVLGRFSLTEEGQALQGEADEAMRQHIIQLSEEFSLSPEYKKLVAQQPKNQEELDELNEKINAAFQKEYGEEINNFMQPYYQRINDAASERYKGTIEEESRKLNVQDSAKRLTTLSDQIDDLREKHGQTASANLRAASKLVKESNNLLKAVDKGSWSQAAQGFWDNIDERTLPFVGGFLDWADNETLKIAINKFEKGENLNKEEEALLTASAINMTLNAYYDDKLRGYKIGTGVADSLPYMMEFIAVPLGGTSNAIAKSLLKFGMKKFGARAAAAGYETAAGQAAWGAAKAVNSAVPRFAARLAGEAGMAALRTETASLPRVLSDMASNMNANYSLSVDANGGLHMQKTGDTTPMEAFSKSLRTNFYDNFGETALDAVKGFGKFVPEKIAKALKYAENTNLGQIYKHTLGSELANRAEWHGAMGEYLEEVLTNLMNYASGDAKWEDVADLDKNIDTFLQVLPVSLLFGIGGATSYGVERYQNKKAMEAAFGQMNDAQKEQLAELQDMAKDGRKALNRGIKNFLEYTIKDETLTQEEKRAEIEYLYEMAKGKAIEEIGEGRTPEEHIADDVEEAKVTGAEAVEPADMNQIGINLQAAAQDVESALGVNTLNALDADPMATAIDIQNNPAFTIEEKQTALDYINAKSAYDGMIGRIQGDIESEVEASDEQVNQQVNATSGMVQPVVLKNGNREAYVVNGNLVMNEDGTINLENSQQDVIIRDKETGKLEFVPVSDIVSADMPINPDELKATNAEAIRESKAQEQSAIIDGTLSFAEGDTYQAVGEDGTPVEVTIISDNGDGTVNVGINGEASAEPMAKDALQQMVDRFKLQQVQTANMERRAAQQAAQQPAEAPATSYELNEQIPVTLSDGTQGTAVIVSEVDADGNYQVELQNANGQTIGVQLMNADELSAMTPQQPVPQNETIPEVQPEQQVETPEAIQEQPENIEPATEEQPMPMIGEGENAEPNYGAVSPQRTHKYIYQESGLDEANADQLVQVKKKEADDLLKDAKKNEPKFGDKGIGSNINKFKSAHQQWENKIADAQRQVDYWNAVEQEQAMAVRQREAATKAETQQNKWNALEQARQEEEAAPKETPVTETTTTETPAAPEPKKPEQKKTKKKEEFTPRNLEELAAYLLGDNSKRGIKLIRKDWMKETGYGNEEAKKYFPIFAKKENGGITVSEAGDLLQEYAADMGIPFDDTDPNAGRNAIISIFQMGNEKWTDLKNYIKNSRQAEGQQLDEYEEELRDDWYMEHFGVNYEEYESGLYDELMDAAGEEYADVPDAVYEQIVDEDNTLNTESNGRDTEEEAGAEGSPAVLQGTQPVLQGRDGEAEGQSEEAAAGVRGEEETVPESTSRGEVEQYDGYTVEPYTYTKKNGSTIDMLLVKFDNLDNETKKKLGSAAREMKGWWSREDGGYLLRSRDDVQKLADIANEDIFQMAERISNEAEKEPENLENSQESGNFTLTLEALENSDLDEFVKSGARAWINGDKSPANQLAYLAAEDYVRSISENHERGGSNADIAQLGSTDNGVASRENGRGNGESGLVDTENGGEGISTDTTGREDSTPDVASSNGEGGDRGLFGNPSEPNGDIASGESAGSSSTGSQRSNGRGRGQQGSSRVSGKDAIRGTKAAARKELDDALSDFEKILKESFTEPVKGKMLAADPVSLYTYLGAVKAIKLLSAGSRVAYAAVKLGYYEFKDWYAVMKSKLGNMLGNVAGLTDDQIDGFIEMMWDYSLTIDGETHKISEWASIIGDENLRNQVSMTIEEKRKLQKQAEDTPTIVEDITNIRESLPFLLPKQQDDVQKAERQFFSEDHQDAKHGHGKGYMFTNGTGTGKTYTGLGIIKRFLKQGKKRILIVTAQETKIKDWINDAKNLCIEATMLPDTKSKGSGVVVTQYANIRQNRALLEDVFDLIVYDESHKLMENQDGMPTSTSRAHHMLANRDERQAARRILMAGEFGKKVEDAENELDLLKQALNISTTKWSDDVKKAYQNVLNSGKTVDERVNELREIVEKLEDTLEKEVDNYLADPEHAKEARDAAKKTKVVFLSATPFNTPANLDYAEGYTFSYTNTDDVQKETDRMKSRDNFLVEHFNASHQRNPKTQSVGRIAQERIPDPLKASEEEVVFSDYMQNELETMSGRDLDSEYDYSREFPKMDFPMAEKFNDAIQSLSDGRFDILAPFFDHLLKDYNTMTGYLEIFKAQMIAPRIRQYIDLGKKVTLFHRRKASNTDMYPPFSLAMQKAMEQSVREDNEDIADAVNAFKQVFRDLFRWENSIDYMFPQDSILNEFMTDKEKEEYKKANDTWNATYGEELQKLSAQRMMLNMQLNDDNRDRDKILEQIRDINKSIEKIVGKRPKPKCAIVSVFNGSEKEGDRSEAVKNFNDDKGKTKVLVVQVQSGKEGISLHDTTGEHPRVQIGIFLPQSPIEFIQTEGRIFRVGNKSNAIFEYPLLGLDIELSNFALKINGRSETTENLALGSRGRGLKESISRAALASRHINPQDAQGIGGKELDNRKSQQADGFTTAMQNYDQWRTDVKPEDVNDIEIPDPIGFMMVKWGNPDNGERVLVPNARKGSVARYVPTRSRMTAMEWRNNDFARLTALVGGSGRKVLNESFDDHSYVNKYDLVVINTAHGLQQESSSLGLGEPVSADAKDAMKAIRHLEDSGRAIMLVSSDRVKDILASIKGSRDTASVVPVAEVKLPSFVLNGTPSSILVVDRIDNNELRVQAGKMQTIDLSGAKDEDTLYAQIRDVAVPNRSIDKVGKITKRLRPMVTVFANTGTLAKEKESGTNKMVPDCSVYKGNLRAIFQRGRMTYMRDPNRAYRGFWIDGSKIANNDVEYIQDLANSWVYQNELLNKDDEALYYEYSWYINHDRSRLGGVRDAIRAIMQSIELALDKTPMQIRNIAEGKVENEVSGSYDLKGFREVFDSLNADDAGLEALADKVFDAVSKIDGLQFRVVSGNAFRSGAGHNVVAHYVPSQNIIELNGDIFNSIKTTDEFKAQTIVHEMIHALTTWALNAYDHESSRDMLTQQQQEACKIIKDVYAQINNDAFRYELRKNSKLEDNAEYGLTNEHEMMAELANPVFRAMLKAKNLWKQLINGIKMLLGIEIPGVESTKTDALTELENAFDTLIENFDPELYKRFTHGDYATRNYMMSQKAGAETNVPVQEETKLRDALTDLMRQAGIEVIDDVEEGQRVLDEAGGQAKMMGFTNSKEDFDSLRDLAIKENGFVLPGLAEKKVTLVKDTEELPFDMTLNDTELKRQVKKYAKDNATKMLGEVPVEGGKVNVGIGSIGEMSDPKSYKKSVHNGVSKDAHFKTLLHIKDIIANSVDCEIYPDYKKNENEKRSPENEAQQNTLMHVFYGSIEIDGKVYPVRCLVKEQRGKGQNNAYMYSLEEIELSDGHNEAAISEPLRKSESSIPLAKIIKGVEKSYDSGKKLLDESKKVKYRSIKLSKDDNTPVLIAPESVKDNGGVLGTALSTPVTRQEVEQVVNSKGFQILMDSITSNDPATKGQLHFGFWETMIREFAKARLAINNKYDPVNTFNNSWEAIEDYISFAKGKGLDASIADKYDFRSGSDDVKNIMEHPEDMYSEQELDEIKKYLSPKAFEDFSAAVRSLSEAKQIRSEEERIMQYDNGAGLAKAYILWNIANKHLADEHSGDNRLFERKPEIVKRGKLHGRSVGKNENLNLADDEEVIWHNSLKKEVVKELLHQIATSPITEQVPLLENKPMFFRTSDGQAYGYTLNGKIYIDPRIATAETPIHEFAHLWAEALRNNDAKEWANVVNLMKGTPIWDDVKKRYPELKTDDELAEEVLAHYSGQRGAERLREAQAEAMKNANGVFEKAEIATMFDNVRRALSRFWKAVADFLNIHYTSAEEVADRVLYDLLSGVNPNVSETDIDDMTDEQLLDAIDLGGAYNDDPYAIEYDDRHQDDYNAYYEQAEEAINNEHPDVEVASDRLGALLKQWRRNYNTDMRTALQAQIEALDNYIAAEQEKQVDAEVPEEFTPGVQPKQEGSEATTYVTTKGKKVEYTQLSLDFTEEEKPVGVDLTQVRLRPLKEGETCYVERRFTRDNTFALTGGKNKIESPDDIAYIFRCLEDKAIEHAFIVFVKDGQPTIVHAGMGDIDNTLVDYSPLAVLAEELNPDYIYFVHNHPSGSLKPSSQDMSLTNKLHSMAPNVPMANIIIDTYKHQYRLFNSYLADMEGNVPDNVSETQSIPLFAFDETKFEEGFSPVRISDSSDIFNTIYGLRFGKEKKIGYLVLDKAYNVLGNLYLDVESVDAIDEGVIKDMLRNVTLMKGLFIALYGTAELNKETFGKIHKDIKRFSGGDINVLDVLKLKGTDGDFAGFYSFHDHGELAEPETPYGFEVHDSGEYEPTKTGKGYKVFVLKDGKLYPPMVANPNGEATPVDEWLTANAAPVVSTSKTGRPQVKAGGKGTQGGSGTLAYRPGWHLGEIPYASQFNRKGANGEKNLFPKNFVWAEVDYANDVDYQDEARKEGINENGKYQHSLAGLKKVPANGSYRYRTNPNPNTDEWIITGAMKVNRILTPSEVDAMVRAAGREPQQRQEGAVTDEQVQQLNDKLFGVKPLQRMPGEDLFAYAERVAETDRRRREMESEEEVVKEEPLPYDDAVKVADDFAKENKGAGRSVILDSRKDRKGKKQQLLDAGISDADAERWLNSDDAALYSPDYDVVVILKSNVGETKLNSYLWHENVHRAVAKAFGNDADRRIDITYRKMFLLTPLTLQLDKDVREAYEGEPEYVIKEEFIANVFEAAVYSPFDVETFMDNTIKVRGKDGNLSMLKDIVNYVKYGNKEGNEGGRPTGSSGRVSERSEEARTDEVRNTERANTGEKAERSAKGITPTPLDIEKAAARGAYEAEVTSKAYEIRESLQDSMRGLHALYKAVLGDKFTHIEDVPEFENAYLAENRMSSKNLAEQTEYVQKYLNPLLDAVHKLAGSDEAGWDELSDYMMAKHGLERNKVLAERDARRVSDDWKRDALADNEANLKRSISELEDRLSRGLIDRDAFDNKMEELKLMAEAAREGINQEAERLYMAEVADNRKKDYAGLTALTGNEPSEVAAAEAEAQRMVDEYEGAHDADDIEDLWDKTRAATHNTLEKTYKSGLQSKDAYEKTLDMFEYYIPLRGFSEKTSDQVYDYLMDDSSPLKGSILKTAEGRRSKADNPIVYIAQMANKAIMEGNRNRMKQKFLNFVINHPSDLVSVSDIWIGKNDATDEWEALFPSIDPTDTTEEAEQKMQEFEERMNELKDKYPDKYKRAKESPNIPYRILNNNLREHQVLVKRNGVPTVLTINSNPRAAQALNGMTNPDSNMSRFLKFINTAVGEILRFMSNVYTSGNPEFVLSNFLRDFSYSATISFVKENANYAAQFEKNRLRFNPLTMHRLFRKFENGTLDDSNETERLFHQFMLNGGETGYTNVLDIAGHRKEIVKALKMKDATAARKILKALAEQYDMLNRSVENVARFAAFVTSREMGRTIGRSIWDAKEISVNFNKKGSADKFFNTEKSSTLGNIASGVSTLMRLTQVFFNAAVQALTNVARAGKRNPKKFSALASGLAAIGLMQPIVAELFSGGGGDGDDDDEYYNIPEYVRRSHIMIRIPGTHNWAMLPLTQEYRAIFGLGEMLSGMITGKETYEPAEAAGKMAALISQALPVDMLEGAGGIGKLVPSQAQPLYEAWVNKDWTGLPIYRKDVFPGEENKPEWTRVYKSADQTLVGISKALNELTGGEGDFKQGWADINPAVVEHIMEGYFGGYWNTVMKTKKTAETLFGERDFDPRNIFLLSRVMYRSDERTQGRKTKELYYKYKEEAEKTKQIAKGYENQEEAGIEGAAEKADFYYLSDEYGRYQIYEKYRPDITAARKSKNEAEKEGDETEAKLYAEEENDLMKQMVEEMEQFNKERK